MVVSLYLGRDDYDELYEFNYAEADIEEIRRVGDKVFAQVDRRYAIHGFVLAFFVIAHVWLEMALKTNFLSTTGQFFWSMFALFSIALPRLISDLPLYTLLLDGAIVATICLLSQTLVKLYRYRKTDSPQIEPNPT